MVCSLSTNNRGGPLFDREIREVFLKERFDLVDVVVEGDFKPGRSKLNRHTPFNQSPLVIGEFYVPWVTALHDLTGLVQIQIAGEVIQDLWIPLQRDFMTEGLGCHSRDFSMTADLSKVN
jgi:hypothetical protein